MSEQESASQVVDWEREPARSERLRCKISDWFESVSGLDHLPRIEELMVWAYSRWPAFTAHFELGRWEAGVGMRKCEADDIEICVRRAVAMLIDADP